MLSSHTHTTTPPTSPPPTHQLTRPRVEQQGGVCNSTLSACSSQPTNHGAGISEPPHHARQPQQHAPFYIGDSILTRSIPNRLTHTGLDTL